jgi:hypothetical protein
LIAGLAVLWFTVIAWATRDNRDAAHDGRSIDRYSHAMRVLSRRAPSRPARSGASVAGRYVLVPGTAVTGGREAARGGAARPALSAVERRRRTLRQLVIASGVSFAGILLGGPWLVIHLLVDAGLVAYVVFLRRSALRSAEIARRERRAALALRESEHRAAYEAAHAPTATVLEMPERPEQRRAVND